MKIEKHILNALDLLKTIEDELRKNCVKILKLKEVKEHLVEAYMGVIHRALVG